MTTINDLKHVMESFGVSRYTIVEKQKEYSVSLFVPMPLNISLAREIEDLRPAGVLIQFNKLNFFENRLHKIKHVVVK